ncbi:MAG: hemerythrin domain-containing protein [Tepidiformaceae bacterium]
MTQSTKSLPHEIQEMVAHHAGMNAELKQMVGALQSAVAARKPFTTERDAVSKFASMELVPHAQAEEDVIYHAGLQLAAFAPLVAGMTMEHVVLVGLAGDLAKENDGVAAASTAAALFTLFKVHVQKENELLLPGLIENGTDPAKLLSEMEHAFGVRQAAAKAAA